MDEKIYTILKKALPTIEHTVSLKDHTTFKIGGPAEYFFVAKTKEDVLKAVALAKEHQIPIFLLGGGSNLLVRDSGVEGLVIKIQSQDDYSLEGNILSANAGVELKTLVAFSVQKGLAGLEWAGGLPGSLGGAIRGNAGAFGGEIKDSILSVQALDSQFNVQTFSREQCHFAYRNSIFKEKTWPVISAQLALKEGKADELKTTMDERIAFRKEKHPLEYPNAGSIFKNVDVTLFSKEWQDKLAMVVKKDPFPVVPTAYLVSEAGLKGKTVGQAQVSPKHPNFIVNLGGAKADDVLTLIDFVKKAIKKKYGVDLETEVQIIGK